jgi:hypothetical protein
MAGDCLLLGLDELQLTRKLPVKLDESVARDEPTRHIGFSFLFRLKTKYWFPLCWWIAHNKGYTLDVEL